MPEYGDWNEWAKRVLGDIERIDKKLDEMIAKIDAQKIELEVQKTKVAMIGVIAGIVVSVIVGVISTILATKLG